ncbi:uncharacterized protein [Temnothorax longispinosus]|uniref:uncharacterized protein n=1 Tax=Temnothorax longispinosus TaxID=300112 RepID=UPI003A996610
MVIKKLKTGKAIGNDGIPNEAWKFGGEEMVKWIWEICKRVWRGEGWPEQWKEDIEDYIKKGRWGGIRLRGEKIYTLMYADDIALLAEEEQDMRLIISRLEEYLDGKILTLNIEKTKIMRFRKGGGKKKKYDWRWKGKKLEEVNEFKYLGYTLKKNGGQEAHIRERRRKAARVMREVWGIRKRMRKKDCKRRIWLHDTLI